MSFPLEIYPVAIRIAHLLDLKEFQFTPEVKGEKKGGYPDAKLMGLLVVACKLGYNLEKSPAWKEWANVTEREKKYKGQANDEIGETDVLTMEDEKLDQYMDWIQSKWIDQGPDFGGMQPKISADIAGKKRIPDGILAMFPLDPPKSFPPENSPTSGKYIHLQPTNGLHTENYKIYRASSTTPPILDKIIHRGSSVIGVGEDSLRYSIRWLESKLCKWKYSVA